MSLVTLLKNSTKEAAFSLMIQTMSALGVPTTSWQKDDTTRALSYAFSILAEGFGLYIGDAGRANWLDFAPDTEVVGGRTWLDFVGFYKYGATRIQGTQSECMVRLTNTGGGLFNFIPFQITVRNPATGATFRNVNGGSLAGGGTLTLLFRCDQAGSIGTATAGTITEMVTVFLRVTCTNTTGAVGRDREPRQAYIDRCRAKLGNLSPNGPSAAVRYVCLTPELNGGVDVVRCTLDPDSTIGQGMAYIAGPSGLVAPADVALVQAGVLKHATPICFTPIVVSGTPVTVAVTQTVYVYDDVNVEDADLEIAFSTALDRAIDERPIGGDHQPPSTQGWLYKSVLDSAPFRAVALEDDETGDGLKLSPFVFRVATATPSADTMLDPEDTPIPGTHTITIIRVKRGTS